MLPPFVLNSPKCLFVNQVTDEAMASRQLKLKELETYLEEVDGFENPKVLLEQYSTPAHLAACMLYTIHTSFDGIKDKHVLDLGCGCGVLSIGAVMLGASKVTAVDVDEDALAACQQNIEEFEMENIDLELHDITDLGSEISERLKVTVDTVVMNPPFGTKHNKGIDMQFVKTGLSLTSGAVYSLHKTSTREHIQKKAEDWGMDMTILAEMKYNLKCTLKSHKKDTVDIEVDFIRFAHKSVKK
ncbi:rRNA N6-adenosine-methyltransferase METTL5-like isoform X2 [Dreissena polymorpha]|uniref:rRNA N6-adenosine-methyltransferase METTL5-like isoform X2 n=1 Tax=Dreissena polymorpha TaxID=45954 RepID=UPI002264F7D7|nr:rRNA N6-adenosine-methyltransferase METTL5-like isoform X2 [Dreissena polymorpha]